MMCSVLVASIVQPVNIRQKQPWSSIIQLANQKAAQDKS